MFTEAMRCQKGAEQMYCYGHLFSISIVKGFSLECCSVRVLWSRSSNLCFMDRNPAFQMKAMKTRL